MEGESKTKSILVVVAGILSMILLVAGIIAAVVCIKQYNCEHVWDDGKVKVEATCTREGSVVYTCDDCGKTQKETVAKRSHLWEDVEKVDATCTKDGHNAYIVCDVCGAYKEDNEFEAYLALGHDEENLPARAATCTEPGITAGMYCKRCDEVLVKQREIPATGHNIVQVPAKAATCTDPGNTAGQKCANCDKVYLGCDIIDPLGGPHIDVDGDLRCDSCHVAVGQRITNASEFKVGAWYRFYLNSNDPNAMAYIKLNLKYDGFCDGTVRDRDEDEKDLSFVVIGNQGDYPGILYEGEWLLSFFMYERGTNYIDVYIDEYDYKASGSGYNIEFGLYDYTNALEIYSTNGSYVAVIDAGLLGYME